MDDMTFELVAIAASVAGHCQPCFMHHLGKAKGLGASEEDIRKCIMIAGKISAAGDQRMAEFVENAIKAAEELK